MEHLCYISDPNYSLSPLNGRTRHQGDSPTSDEWLGRSADASESMSYKLAAASYKYTAHGKKLDQSIKASEATGTHSRENSSRAKQTHEGNVVPTSDIFNEKKKRGSTFEPLRSQFMHSFHLKPQRTKSRNFYKEGCVDNYVIQGSFEFDPDSTVVPTLSVEDILDNLSLKKRLQSNSSVSKYKAMLNGPFDGRNCQSPPSAEEERSMKERALRVTSNENISDKSPSTVKRPANNVHSSVELSYSEIQTTCQLKENDVQTRSDSEKKSIENATFDSVVSQDLCYNTKVGSTAGEVLQDLSTMSDVISRMPGLHPSSKEDLQQHSCVPSLFLSKTGMERLHKSSFRSTNSRSNSEADFQSIHETENIKFSRYDYNYKSGIHSYVAYFQRGCSASESIRLYEHPKPPSFPTLKSEVVVMIEGSTISDTDCKVRRGAWWEDDSNHSPSLPVVPGVAFMGIIIQVDKGAQYSGLKVGDRVASLVRGGANSRHICVDKERVVKVPPNIRCNMRVACLPEVYLTSFQVLHIGQKKGMRYKRNSLEGKSIFLLDGTTPYGRALIELGVSAGAIVYAIGREKHFKDIKAAGGHPIHCNPQHWFPLLKGRIDIVVEYKKDDETHSDFFNVSKQALNPNGKRIVIGAPERMTSNSNAEEIEENKFPDHHSIIKYNVFDSWDANEKQAKRDLSFLLRLLMEGDIKPVVLDTIPLNKVAKAQDILEKKDVKGFILCHPWIERRHVDLRES